MTETDAAPDPASVAETSQYLTFLLDTEEYGIDILKVQEIRGFSGLTPIPNTPPHIRGVMNLRGTVIPVVDLRLKFALQEAEYTKFTVIIVVSVASKNAGLIVDAVSDVVDITPAQVRPTPGLGARSDTRFITGMAETGEKLAVLLDVEELLRDDSIIAAQHSNGN